MPGLRVHTIIFVFATILLTGATLIGKSLANPLAWPAIFAAGISLAGTYLVLGVLSLRPELGQWMVHPNIKIRTVLLAGVFLSVLSLTLYGLSKVARPEDTFVFPPLLVIFYGWILAQAYFIASPLGNLMVRGEARLQRNHWAGRLLPKLAKPIVMGMVAPVVVAIWLASSWINSYYSTQSGSGGPIYLWTVGMILAVIVSFLFVLRPSLESIVRAGASRAVSVAGVFVIVWIYLFYRALMVLTGYLNQYSPTNILIDGTLMLVSIVGAMQTFAKKTLDNSDKRLSVAAPFLVFSFGSIYATVTYYFILEVPITRTELSLVVNSLVFASGLVTLLFVLLRKVIKASPRINTSSGPVTQGLAVEAPSRFERQEEYPARPAEFQDSAA